MRQVVILEPSHLVREGLARLLAEGGFAVVDPGRASDLDVPPVQDESVDLVLTELPAAPYRMASWLERIGAFFPRASIVLLTKGPACPEVARSALACGARGYVDKDISIAGMYAVIAAVLHGQTVCPAAVRDCLLVTDRAPDRAPDRIGPVRQEQASRGAGDDLRQAPARPRPTAHGIHPDILVADMPGRPVPVPLAGHVPALARSHSRPEPEATVRVSPSPRTAADPQVSLSDREAEILRHLAEGHANKIIAHRLSISEATVKSHLKSLLRKLRFSNRTQAAIWAISRCSAGRDSAGAGASAMTYATEARVAT